jgi:signal transduction histidine kinase
LDNHDNSYFLTVKDFGVGIEEEKLNKMGELQVDTTDAIEVHGIGFYLAQKLLEALGHSIMINSVREVGTTVAIKLR